MSIPDRYRINTSLHEEDYRLLQRKAKEWNYKVAPLLREAALAQLRETAMLPREIEEEIRDLRMEIQQQGSALGGNLNQIARHVNRMQKVTIPELRKARQYVYDFCDQAEERLAALEQRIRDFLRS